MVKFKLIPAINFFPDPQRLHSNMVKFKSKLYEEVLVNGYCLHSNMVKFKLEFNVPTKTDKEVYIPIWLNSNGNPIANWFERKKRFTFQYG